MASSAASTSAAVASSMSPTATTSSPILIATTSAAMPTTPVTTMATATTIQDTPLLLTGAQVQKVKEGDDTFIPIPGMEEASLKIYQSQVLLPFSLADGSVHAFLGPFAGQNTKRYGNTLLPEDSTTLPFIYSPEIDLNLFGDTTKIFRAFPPVKERHLSWLARVEASMSSEWKETGIFEFIQLAKFDLHLFDPQMLLSAIFFWNRETRAFEFPCGFICPTLLDVAAITGLKPIGDRFYPDAFEEEISIKDTSISWDKKTYLAFINAHMGQPDTPVSPSEHIAFLMYWLSACVFCTPSLQVPKYYYNLAQALHLQRKICLSKLLLASLYTCLDEASESLARESGPRNLSGPLWLLQLWLNALLEKKLHLPSKPIPICELEGARLTTLTPRKRLVDNFEKYIRAILSFTDFTEDLAPFIRPNLIGPTWLRQNNQVGSISPASTDLWFGFLSWDVIMSGMRQKDVRLYPYQPQLFARQFGLCQMKPLPLRRKEGIDADICVEKGNYEEVLNFILRPDKELRLTPTTFSPSFLVSKCYLRWWCYYIVDKLTDFDGFLKKLISSPLSCSQGPKQPGTFKNQLIIYQFEQFFKVCYRPDNAHRTIFDASVSLSKMVQRNIRSKKVINPQGKTDFEKFCPKHIPPLPNALFGLVKHVSHPPWVKTLDPFYLERKEVPVKNKVTYARCSVYDFPRNKWWPLCWVNNINPPPAAIPQRVPRHVDPTPDWESDDDEDKETSKKGRKRKTAADKVSLRSKSIGNSKKQRIGSDSTKTVSTTKKQDKGKGKMVLPLPKKPQQSSGEKLLKDAMKSVPKDIAIIPLDSSQGVSQEVQKSVPFATEVTQHVHLVIPCDSNFLLMFSLTSSFPQLSTPQVDVAALASAMASIEVPPPVEEGKIPQPEPLTNMETRQDSAQGSTESPRPFTTSPSTQGGATSSVQGLSLIPSPDLDLMSFFNDEDEDINTIFEVLDNWTSGPSGSEKDKLKVVEPASDTPSYQPLLDSFRSKAYVKDLDQAFLIPEFKTEVQQMIDELLSYSDLPSDISLELQAFIKPFSRAWELRTQWSTAYQEVTQIEVETEGDRAKLEKLRDELVSIKKSTEEMISALQALQKEEADIERTIEALNHELDKTRSKKDGVKIKSQEIKQHQTGLKEEGKAISSRLAKTLEQKRHLEAQCASRKKNLDEAYKAFEDFKKQFLQ
ncbi:uncharacterized protein LOC109814161 isoform X2 [Cajanus cajan]|uniref:uncharacterized protein LOC109790165 isoform X2 n=1 Tax=Cajanus cajan TaxID=3821 RepID=UPI0010FB2FA9|nr:uncharacterized protein LOC109790165 isoform X2 [Cajanus cajan]XP_029130366.1 uncharacterized protein LOC109814161 isoform X2 [Cajanus cajan]